MIKGHGGNIYDLARELGCAPSDIIDMSSNVNPVGPPPGLMNFLAENLGRVAALPEVDAREARRALAGRHGVDPACLLAGNGSTQFIYCLPRALESRRALILGPAYADYADACRMNKVPYEVVTADEAAGFIHDPVLVSGVVGSSGADTVFICNPNNPTGVMMAEETIIDLCAAHPRTRFIIDEAYLGFAPRGTAMSLMRGNAPDNAVVLDSMSKLFRIPGLRIGFVFASSQLIEKIAAFSLPWSANSLSQAAVVWLMENKTLVDAFIDETVGLLEKERAFLSDRLGAMSGIRLFPSLTSFILAALKKEGQAEEVCRYLGSHKILIRNCANFHGLSSRHIRFSLKTHADNMRLVEKLHHYFIDKEMK